MNNHMRHNLTRLALVSLLMAWPTASRAQLAAPNKAGVAMGHLHYTVKDVEINKKFWMALGATPIKIGTADVMKLPDILIFLEKGESSGGNEEAVVNHVAFMVPSVKETLAKLEAAGFKIRAGGGGDVGNMITPEGEAIEIFSQQTEQGGFIPDKGHTDAAADRLNRKLTVPITSHHIHFELPTENAVPVARDWYIKMFGAIPGVRWHYPAANLPGVNFNFREKRQPPQRLPTKGRLLDHIGLEVKDLEQFCKKLEADGIKLDVPYTRNPNGFASAFLTDPWGTYIELTEGLNRF